LDNFSPKASLQYSGEQIENYFSNTLIMENYFNPAWISDLKARTLKAVNDILAKVSSPASFSKNLTCEKALQPCLLTSELEGNERARPWKRNRPH